MLIRCRVERDGQGVVLSKIESIAEAISLRAILVEKGLSAIVAKPGGPGDFRLSLADVSVEAVEELAAGLNLKLIQ